jgi:hypothetical protein
VGGAGGSRRKTGGKSHAKSGSRRSRRKRG